MSALPGPGKFDWVEALAKLRSGSMSLTDYEAAVRDRRVQDYHGRENQDDSDFQQAYPGHPLGEINRGRRIAAADSIRDALLADPGLITDQRLAILHEALFDCSAAVREAMVVILAWLARKESLLPLQKLEAVQRERPDDVSLPQYVEQAISVIEGRLQFQDAPKLRVWLRVHQVR